MTERLSAYLDGELDDAEAREVTEAIERDEALRDECRSLRETRRLLRALPREAAPDELADRVLAQAERKSLVTQAPSPRQAPKLRWARYAAAAAVLVVAGGVIAVIVQSMYTAGQYDQTQTVHRGDEGDLGDAYDAPDGRRIAGERKGGDKDGERLDKSGGGPGGELASRDPRREDNELGVRRRFEKSRDREDTGKGTGGAGTRGPSTTAKPAAPGPRYERSRTVPATTATLERKLNESDNNVRLAVYDMRQGQRDVETFLIANGIASVRADTERASSATAPPMARGNFYYNQRINGREQYVAFVPREQLDEYKKKLARRVSTNQLALTQDRTSSTRVTVAEAPTGEPATPPEAAPHRSKRGLSATEEPATTTLHAEDRASAEADGDKAHEEQEEPQDTDAAPLAETTESEPTPGWAAREADKPDEAYGAAHTGETEASQSEATSAQRRDDDDDIAWELTHDDSGAETTSDVAGDAPAAATRPEGGRPTSRPTDGICLATGSDSGVTEAPAATRPARPTLDEETQKSGALFASDDATQRRPASQPAQAKLAEDVADLSQQTRQLRKQFADGQVTVDALRRQWSQAGADVEPLVITLEVMQPAPSNDDVLLRQMDAHTAEADRTEASDPTEGETHTGE
ncbi:MAG: hypothetical protein KGY99_10340 [Phycisphaerae bacterium]|nr:hypothetical protein [Phycisphaerae bacterium]